MKIYHCGNCTQLLYFESVQCVSCHHALGFFPDINQVCAMNQDDYGNWHPIGCESAYAYHQCNNYKHAQVCNWMVRDDDPEQFCLSCRLNLIIPNLDKEENRVYWQRLELAKRRLVYGLISLNLPVVARHIDPEKGLGFKFLADSELDMQEPTPVMTGHDAGVITINVAEADDSYREKMRQKMRERYRTLLGHFRHESGHYYWFRLIQNSSWLQGFRQLFGDESTDYDSALEAYYGIGPQVNWDQSYISRYASAHPWEDWAETWAHYLHMHYALETARAWGMTLSAELTGSQPDRNNAVTKRNQTFDNMCENWVWLSCALNSLNRSMGFLDIYPFVLNDQVIEKLWFVHQVIKDFTEDELR